MTTILYTPGSLTADSRERLQNSGEISSDDIAKIYVFKKPIELTVPYNGGQKDIVEVGAGTGKADSVAAFFRMLVRYGSDVYQRYLEMTDIFGNSKDVGECTIILVGRENVHVIALLDREGDLSIQHALVDLQETRAWGSGGMCAQFLASMLNMPPRLAVAASSIVDPSTGGHVTSVNLHVTNEERRWEERSDYIRTDRELLGDLSGFFQKLDPNDTPLARASDIPVMRKPRTIRLARDIATVEALSSPGEE